MTVGARVPFDSSAALYCSDLSTPQGSVALAKAESWEIVFASISSAHFEQAKKALAKMRENSKSLEWLVYVEQDSTKSKVVLLRAASKMEIQPVLGPKLEREMSVSGLSSFTSIQVILVKPRPELSRPPESFLQFDQRWTRAATTVGERGWRLTGRVFLESGRREEPGFGLYSYVLLPMPPTKSTIDRYTAVLQSMLDVPEVKDFLTVGRRRDSLNATYIPVRRLPLDEKPSVQWIFDNYDYARAQVSLSIFPKYPDDGPFIISTLSPLAFSAQLDSNRYFYQDLSSVPISVVPIWIHEFETRAAREDFWQSDTFVHSGMALRTAISEFAQALPSVRSALAGWIQWKNVK